MYSSYGQSEHKVNPPKPLQPTQNDKGEKSTGEIEYNEDTFGN